MELPLESPLTFQINNKINANNTLLTTLQSDLTKLQTAQKSWQTLDSDFTGLQSSTSYTLSLCHTPCDSYGIRSCQNYLSNYNDTQKSGCSSELDEQTRLLQTLIASKEQQISTVQGNINFLTYQLEAL